MTIVENLKKKYYPDDKKDGTFLFYKWIREYSKPGFIILNVGAGATAERKLRSFKGEVKQIIGVDIDDDVLKNNDLDKAFVIEKNKFPFADNYFDLAFSDFVLEHVDDPGLFLKEVLRVLKPGASFFFRTPNMYHYVALISILTPHWFHKLVANRVRGLPSNSGDPYPTFYRFNTFNDVNKYAKNVGYKQIEIRLIEADPSYMVFNPVAFLAGVLYERIVNSHNIFSNLRVNILGRLQK